MLRFSDLMKIKRITVDVPDPKTNQKDSYEGVALKELVPSSSGRQVDEFEDTLAFRVPISICSPKSSSPTPSTVRSVSMGDGLSGI